MNPLKCTFGVSYGRFLGFVVRKTWINTDNDKAQAITTLKILVNIVELKSFLSKVSYIQLFIPRLTQFITPFNHLLKKNVKFEW